MLIIGGPKPFLVANEKLLWGTPRDQAGFINQGVLMGSIYSGWWFQPLWKILVGRIIPYIMENKKCLKPPTSIIRKIHRCKTWDVEHVPGEPCHDLNLSSARCLLLCPRAFPCRLGDAGAAAGPGERGTSPHHGDTMGNSLDWFKGKSTGNHGFYHQI